MLALVFCIFSACKSSDENYFDLISPTYTPTTAEIFKDEFDNNAIKMSTNEDIKILQLTDIHIGNGILSVKKDQKAFEAMAKLIENAKPDLIILTGDVVYTKTLLTGSNDNLSALKKVANFIEKYKTPWTMCFGNHDAEYTAKYGKLVLCDYLENEDLKYCLFDRGEEFVGIGNHIINVYNKDSSFNSSLFVFDNGEYDGSSQINGYLPISQYQINWYEENILKMNSKFGTTIQSFAFFHVPLTEYKTAWELYKQESNEVTYFFGNVNENGEKISTPNGNDNFFNKAVQLQSTKAMFCGHNHLNDFSIEYKGIRLTFGKSIDYTAYILQGIANRTEQRGSTILTLKGLNSTMENSFEISSQKLTDIAWFFFLNCITIINFYAESKHHQFHIC